MYIYVFVLAKCQNCQWWLIWFIFRCWIRLIWNKLTDLHDKMLGGREFYCFIVVVKNLFPTEFRCTFYSTEVQHCMYCAISFFYFSLKNKKMQLTLTICLFL